MKSVIHCKGISSCTEVASPLPDSSSLVNSALSLERALADVRSTAPLQRLCQRCLVLGTVLLFSSVFGAGRWQAMSQLLTLCVHCIP